MRVIIATLMLAIVFVFPVYGQQHDHDLYHAQYQGWISNSGFNCCNNQDCGQLPDKDVREHDGHTEVLIHDTRGDEWCPVENKHHVAKGGKSPDWSYSHACIIAPNYSIATCERFKCYMDKARL